MRGIPRSPEDAVAERNEDDAYFSNGMVERMQKNGLAGLEGER